MDKRRMCPNCRAFVTTSDKVCPYCEAPLGPRAIDRRSPADALGGLIPHARFTTTMILLVNAILYIADNVGPWEHVLTQWGASMPASMTGGQWWRLITAGFLHGDILHILMNSWVLFSIGAEVEQLFGTSRFIVIYFVSTVTGFYASSHFFGGHFSVGSSAGIFGLIGAMIAFGVTDKSHVGSMVKSYYSQYLIWCVIVSFLPHVDFMAHAGGFAGGFATAYLASTPRARLMWKEPLLKALAGVSVAITAFAFAMLYLALSAG
ncbi:MAG TPA: rhomboid family intramembrane serine protease [Bryobacteraceae bacterium]|nr:rhomboid family intramembrane serine protease [Bryobacteraceae bacterium]